MLDVRAQAVLGTARKACCLALGLVALAPATAGARTAVPPPPQLDSITANGSGAGFVDVSVSAQSGPSGENPTGTVSTTVILDGPRGPEDVVIGGPVTCLGVTGNTAVVNFDEQTFGFGILTLSLADNGGDGRDTVAAQPIGTNRAPGDCSPLALAPIPLANARVIVVDAAPPPVSARQCKHGGWARYGFTNQGQCIRFVRRHRHSPGVVAQG